MPLETGGAGFFCIYPLVKSFIATSLENRTGIAGTTLALGHASWSSRYRSVCCRLTDVPHDDGGHLPVAVVHLWAVLRAGLVRRLEGPALVVGAVQSEGPRLTGSRGN